MSHLISSFYGGDDDAYAYALAYLLSIPHAFIFTPLLYCSHSFSFEGMWNVNENANEIWTWIDYLNGVP